jgi:hypothetical protein
MHALWAEPHVTFKGKWHTIEDAGINSRPARSALSHVGVQVVYDLEPGLAGGGEERVADRQIKPRRFYRYRPVVAMPLIGSAGVGLGFLEVGQHLLERPPMTAKLRPLVVFERVAAQIQHAVDAARAAEDAPLKPPQSAPVQRRYRLGLEIPIAPGEGAGDERDTGNLRREPEPFAAGLDQGNACIRHRLRQPTGNDTAGRARADHDVIPTQCRRRSCSESQTSGSFEESSRLSGQLHDILSERLEPWQAAEETFQQIDSPVERAGQRSPDYTWRIRVARPGWNSNERIGPYREERRKSGLR